MEDPRKIFYDNRKAPDVDGETPRETTKQGEQAQEKATRLQDLQKLADKYEREGENKLISDIFKNVIKEKSEGRLSNAQLTAFRDRIAPMLSREQKERMDGLLEELLKL